MNKFESLVSVVKEVLGPDEPPITCKRVVKSILVALRRPTQEMVEASKLDDENVPGVTQELWEDMIDVLITQAYAYAPLRTEKEQEFLETVAVEDQIEQAREKDRAAWAKRNIPSHQPSNAVVLGIIEQEQRLDKTRRRPLYPLHGAIKEEETADCNKATPIPDFLRPKEPTDEFSHVMPTEASIAVAEGRARRPSVDELQAILDSKDTHNIRLMPDGTVVLLDDKGKGW